MKLSIGLSSITRMVFLCSTMSSATIVKRPKDTEAIVGSDTYFNCFTNTPGEVQWFHYPYARNGKTVIVFSYGKVFPAYLDRFQVETDEKTRASNLKISYVSSEDAGKYECRDDYGNGEMANAQLIVLEADPSCQSNKDPEKFIGPNCCGIEEDKMIFSCKARYFGNVPPILAWQKAGDNTIINEGVMHSDTETSVVYNISLEPTADVDDSSYFCNTTRTVGIKSGCNTGKIKIIGKSQNEVCKSYTVAIAICCILLLILFLIVIVGGFFVYRWYLLNDSKKTTSTENAEGQGVTEIIPLQSDDMNLGF